MLKVFFINPYRAEHMMLAIGHPIQINNQDLLGWQAALIQLLQLRHALFDKELHYQALFVSFNSCLLSVSFLHGGSPLHLKLPTRF
jgi:hypothetical protein